LKMNKIKFCSLSALNRKKGKTFSRSSIILDYHIGNTLPVHDGRRLFYLTISSRMRGYRFGEFCLTRKQFSHKKKKKKKNNLILQGEC
jgi:ribosomal protein S19